MNEKSPKKSSSSRNLVRWLALGSTYFINHLKLPHNETIIIDSGKW